MHGTEYLTPLEVARKLRVSVRCCQAGTLRTELPWVLVSNRLRLKQRDLDAYIRARRAVAAEVQAHA